MPFVSGPELDLRIQFNGGRAGNQRVQAMLTEAWLELLEEHSFAYSECWDLVSMGEDARMFRMSIRPGYKIKDCPEAVSVSVTFAPCRGVSTSPELGFISADNTVIERDFPIVSGITDLLAFLENQAVAAED
jgi:hypothetical protein